MAGTSRRGLVSLLQEMLSASRAIYDLSRREGRFNNVTYEVGYQQALLKLATELGIKEEVNRCSTFRATPKA